MVDPKPYVVAIIPARGGSKSIPRKNIKTLGKFPLIAYSIAAGLQSSWINRVIVSTDDEEIANVAQNWGADVPFIRPDKLSGDHAQDLPVFQHAVSWLRAHDREPDIVVQLRPTSPFRPVRCVDQAVHILAETPEADSVRCVTPSVQNPYKMWQLDKAFMKPLICSNFKEAYNMPRQELPATYWQTGHVEAVRTSTIMEKMSMTGDNILPLILPPEFAVDLDTMLQWEFAEYVIEKMHLEMIMPESHATPLREIELVVSDFDGVMTDDRVWTTQTGVESVACSREDGLGIARLQKARIPVVVLSTEENHVVKVRCDKLNIPCYHGIEDKGQAVEQIARQYHVELRKLAYIGNDLNDLPALCKAGLAIVPSDAHQKVIQQADMVLKRKGGQGAVRELCEKIIEAKGVNP